MRRVAWVVVVVLAVAALAVPAWEPALAQPATVPTPDFDHDGFGDLAVGVPGEDVGGDGDAGAVVVLFGSAGGLGGGRLLTQANPEPGDRFGSALAEGSIDPVGGYADLAVGAPGETVGGRAGAGAVSLALAGDSGFTGAGGQLFHQGAGAGTVLFGDGGGLGAGGSQLLHQGIGGLGGAPEPGDVFGAALG
jgi:hypothetical protein